MTGRCLANSSEPGMLCSVFLWVGCLLLMSSSVISIDSCTPQMIIIIFLDVYNLTPHYANSRLYILLPTGHHATKQTQDYNLHNLPTDHHATNIDLYERSVDCLPSPPRLFLLVKTSGPPHDALQPKRGCRFVARSGLFTIVTLTISLALYRKKRSRMLTQYCFPASDLIVWSLH